MTEVDRVALVVSVLGALALVYALAGNSIVASTLMGYAGWRTVRAELAWR